MGGQCPAQSNPVAILPPSESLPIRQRLRRRPVSRTGSLVSSKCIADTGRNPPQREHGLGSRDSIRADRWVLVFVTERWTHTSCTVDEIPEPWQKYQVQPFLSSLTSINQIKTGLATPLAAL